MRNVSTSRLLYQLVLFSIFPLWCVNAYSSQSNVDTTGLDCIRFEKTITRSVDLNAYGMSPWELEQLTAKCSRITENMAVVLRNFFRYRHMMLERDYPNTMARLPGTNFNSLYKNDIYEIDMLLKKIKTENPTDVAAVLHFMAKQSEIDYTYAWTALEIVARDFPQSYDSYRSLSGAGTEGRRAWEVTKSRWLKKVNN